MHVIKESHIAPVPAVHMRRIDDFDLGIAADVQCFGELGHHCTCRRRFHRSARSHEVVLHIDHDHGSLLRVNHVNLHDLPPRIRNSDVILPMTTVASAGAYLRATPVELGPNARSSTALFGAPGGGRIWSCPLALSPWSLTHQGRTCTPVLRGA